jgi:hypothetical protein
MPPPLFPSLVALGMVIELIASIDTAAKVTPLLLLGCLYHSDIATSVYTTPT